jgi:serine/threonine protein kinase
MEFCPGGDLYAAIKKGGMSPSEVECCFKQMLSGVLYLHSQGVAHRDIKPENLFFDTKGHLKVGENGLCVHAFSRVYRSVTMVHPLYTACHGKRQFTCRRGFAVANRTLPLNSFWANVSHTQPSSIRLPDCVGNHFSCLYLK